MTTDTDPVKVLARKVAAETVIVRSSRRLENAIIAGDHDDWHGVLSAEAAIRATVELAAQAAETEPRSWDFDAGDPQSRIAAKLRSLSFLKGQNDG